MLECDAKLLTSHLARGFAWFVQLHFPMLAYVHVLRYLRGSPSGGASMVRAGRKIPDAHRGAQCGRCHPRRLHPAHPAGLRSAWGGDGDATTGGTKVGDGGATARVGPAGLGGTA